ncbi:hypothetical protein AU196_03310 [Mycobacterium sp. IS-1742]|uniref:DUF2505 domain-containing protein n=1 Tax=Mycobacterium sp. IS-1742 TaxID=1772285 RepID=UPI00074050D9|nr:DUF2505 domain-containing protein [Mycobacterium sp. IS-1742]KUI29929.1 hypothetical protein AU196_03310 [Mycobacterium sp. IS-1742]
MGRRSEHVVVFDVPAEQIHAQFTSEEYWQALTEVYRGLNTRTDLTMFRSDARGADIALRQVIPRDELPPIARKVVPVDLVLTREQHFDPFDDGAARAHGTFAATMPRAPGRLDGRYELSDTATGSRLLVRSRCKVSVPLVGGTLEDLILTGIRELFDGERDFTARWLAGRR